MPEILTLVASDPDTSPLDDALLLAIRERLESFGVGLATPPHWLAPRCAVDLAFDRGAPFDPLSPRGERAGVRGALRPLLDEAKVDLALFRPDPAPADPGDPHRASRPQRRKKLLVADMESTVIGNEMLDELADWVGEGQRIAEITARAMNGELDFRQALRQRVGLLAGLSAEVLDQAAERIRIDPGAATLVATLRHHGVRTVLCSGGFTVYTGRIAEQLGFDTHSANRLEIREGKLTGAVLDPILDRDAKVATLRRHCAELGIGPEDVVAVGDGANDLPMLELAGLGVAFHAKPAVLAAAQNSICHGDLSALLYYQGYTADEIVAPGPNASRPTPARGEGS